MTSPEIRRIGLSVNIRGHQPVEIRPRNDGPVKHTPFIYSLDIARRPGHAISDARIHSARTKESCGVQEVSICRCSQDREADTRYRSECNVENTSRIQSIACKTNRDTLTSILS